VTQPEGLHPVLRSVTERVRSRSLQSRRDYLERMTEAGRDGSARQRLSCTNLAHGFAASSPADKQALGKQMRGFDLPAGWIQDRTRVRYRAPAGSPGVGHQQNRWTRQFRIDLHEIGPLAHDSRVRSEDVVKRETLVLKIWKKNVRDREVDVSISRLKQRVPFLAPFIETLPGGYRISISSFLPTSFPASEFLNTDAAAA